MGLRDRGVGRLRGMAEEFRASFDDMARQSELDELRREVEAMRQSQGALLSSETAEVNQVLREIGDSLQTSDIQFHPPLGGVAPEAAPAEEVAAGEPSPAPEAAVAAAKPRRRRKTAEQAE